MNWYKEVNTQTLKYVTYTIHDSDISDFYRKVGFEHSNTIQVCLTLE